jgi:low affinity Fe/Cu permease
MRVRIVTEKLSEEQLFIRNKFYREIEEMNERLSKFIVNTLQKEADILIGPEDDGQKSLDSCDIIEASPDEKF